MHNFLSRVKRKAGKILLGPQDSSADFNGKYSYPEVWSGHGKKFYGQYGEDLKILPLFGEKKDGYFIEIGAMEGVRFSNTFFFEEMGWKGICIEPHPDYTELLKKNRPNSQVVAAAVGKEDRKSVTFYTNFRGSLSTLDKNLESYFKSHYKEWFGGFKNIEVPLIALNSVVKQYNVPIGFEILSIDTEGTERDVLEGFDIDKYRPKVVIAEVSIKREPVLEYMRAHGYILACENPSNAIFCLSEEDANIVRYTNIIGEQTRTEHPLDQENETK